MATVNENFNTAIDAIVGKITGANSIYDKTLLKLNQLYTDMGMSANDRNKIIAEVSGQLAVSSTNAAIAAAVDIAKSTDVVAAQVLTEGARKELIARQKIGFNDKLLVEAMKAMSGVASMEATSGVTTEGTLQTLKDKITNVESAAGIFEPEPVA